MHCEMYCKSYNFGGGLLLRECSSLRGLKEDNIDVVSLSGEIN